jgi:hypothetical protein
MVKQIKVKISPDGDVTIEAVGYSGTDCERATDRLERALGLRNREQRFKPERFEFERTDEKEATSW